MPSICQNLVGPAGFQQAEGGITSFARQDCLGACSRVVHDDVFTVMKYAFEESVPADAAQKCMDFWVSFVEPFFGLPARAKQQPIVKVRSDCTIDWQAVRLAACLPHSVLAAARCLGRRLCSICDPSAIAKQHGGACMLSSAYDCLACLKAGLCC